MQRCDVPNFKTMAMQVDCRCVFALAYQIRHSGVLRSQTFCKLYFPSAADIGVCRRHLKNDPPFRDLTAVIATVNKGDEPVSVGHALGFGWSKVCQPGNAHLASVNGKAHGEQGRCQKDQ